VAVKSPSDMGKMIENVEKLRSISHNMRGTEIEISVSQAKTKGDGKIFELGEFKVRDDD